MISCCRKIWRFLLVNWQQIKEKRPNSFVKSSDKKENLTGNNLGDKKKSELKIFTNHYCDVNAELKIKKHRNFWQKNGEKSNRKKCLQTPPNLVSGKKKLKKKKQVKIRKFWEKIKKTFTKFWKKFKKLSKILDKKNGKNRPNTHKHHQNRPV